MWNLYSIQGSAGSQLKFDDGKDLYDSRGGPGMSSRLIIEGQGFIDISDIQLPPETTPKFVDLNNKSVSYNGLSTSIQLILPGDGTFKFSLRGAQEVTGQLKPIPQVSLADTSSFLQMIDKKYVPYPNVPDIPGKTTEEIKALGARLFPFCRSNHQLAMAVYDWTTASFTRMVLMRIFAYTGIPQDSKAYRLDLKSIAKMIWESNWESYTPQNEDFMNSFMMKPAKSMAAVESQLKSVRPELQKFVDVQNRILAAAFTSMPRTTVQFAPQLFSGQPDIRQLGLSRFPIQFLECPLNNSVDDESLEMPFNQATEGFLKPGSFITTKMVWSFADSIDIAAHYHNGLILIANPPDDSVVWESAAFITPLSNDPKKNEYTFAPGTRFRVIRLFSGILRSEVVQYIELVVEPLPVTPQAANADPDEHEGSDGIAEIPHGSPGLRNHTTGAGSDNLQGPAVTDAADEADMKLANETAGDVIIDYPQTGIIVDVKKVLGHTDVKVTGTHEVLPPPRLAPITVPMRRVEYPPYNHYLEHLDGGRHCSCTCKTRAPNP
ncbi:hypothetical protein ACGC1H_007351 [Rhizoctonia solani]